jgi:hypothetical protein
MNKIISSKDIKSKVPPLSVSTSTFLLCGKTFACKSKDFQFRHEIDEFVNEFPGRIAIFDQPGYNPPDVPARDADRFIIRYCELPDFVGLIHELLEHEGAEGFSADLKEKIAKWEL